MSTDMTTCETVDRLADNTGLKHSTKIDVRILVYERSKSKTSLPSLADEALLDCIVDSSPKCR